MTRSILIPFLMFVGLASAPAVGGAGATPPNIVFMLSDDQAWNGLSVAMHPDVAGSKRTTYHTPNLETLASEGMRFSAAYAPAPVCAPTRISLITGRSPAAIGWTKAGPSVNARTNPKLLPPNSIRDISSREVTFAELLQDAGYSTAHFGKWHIGGGGPERHGFDVSDGDVGNEAAGRFTDPNPVDIFGMAERAETFMREATEADRPFFVQLSWLALHAPENALEATKAKYEGRGRRAGRGAITEDLDTGVGRVLDAIERLGIADNTYVIYMSDNGGAGNSALAGTKGTLSEGGIRVPLIVRGPGVEADSWSHVPVVGFDLYPTYLEWAGIDGTPQVIEGGSIAGLLAGTADRVERPREELVFHFPHYQNAATPQSVIFADGYKLLTWYEDGSRRLYKIDTDLGERVDLASEKPEVADRLAARLDSILDELGAKRPVPNESYNPDQPTTTNERGRRRGRDSDSERPRRPGGRRGG